MEVAVHEPVRARVELGEQLACERNELAALVLSLDRASATPPAQLPGTAIPHVATAAMRRRRRSPSPRPRAAREIVAG